MRDRSLDEFATDEASEPNVNRDAGDVAGDADDVDRDTPEDDDCDTPEDDVTADEAEALDTPVVPARSTYEWSPTGADCADCGARIERRWRDGDELVCDACKPW